jgi:hypothetical protein
LCIYSLATHGGISEQARRGARRRRARVQASRRVALPPFSLRVPE